MEPFLEPLLRAHHRVQKCNKHLPFTHRPQMRTQRLRERGPLPQVMQGVGPLRAPLQTLSAPLSLRPLGPRPAGPLRAGGKAPSAATPSLCGSSVAAHRNPLGAHTRAPAISGEFTSSKAPCPSGDRANGRTLPCFPLRQGGGNSFHGLPGDRLRPEREGVVTKRMHPSAASPFPPSHLLLPPFLPGTTAQGFRSGSASGKRHR